MTGNGMNVIIFIAGVMPIVGSLILISNLKIDRDSYRRLYENYKDDYYEIRGEYNTMRKEYKQMEKEVEQLRDVDEKQKRKRYIRELAEDIAIKIDEINTREEEDENMINIEKIRKNLSKKIHHQTQFDRHVSILEEVGSGYSVLQWEYNDHKVEARSKDYNLLACLRDCIEMYLEETEQ